MEQIELFGITIHNVTLEETVNRVRELVQAKGKAFVVTPNVDHVVKLQTDAAFLELYKAADLSIPDGMPLVWTSKLAKKPLKGRVTGADLFPAVCADAARTGMTVFLLGSASQDIIETTKAKLLGKNPGLKIVGAHSPSFGFEKREEENNALIQMINEAKPDILFVGVGAPKQEKWIYTFRDRLNVPVSLGVGAAFDFVAGNVKRAPKWMQSVGLEWFYRFLSEPKRMFKRYFIDDFVFLKLALREISAGRKAAKAARKAARSTAAGAKK